MRRAGPAVADRHRAAGDRAADLVVELGSGRTNDDGRVNDLTPHGLAPGTYQLWFDVAAYAAASGQEIFFPRSP